MKDNYYKLFQNIVNTEYLSQEIKKNFVRRGIVESQYKTKCRLIPKVGNYQRPKDFTIQPWKKMLVESDLLSTSKEKVLEK